MMGEAVGAMPNKQLKKGSSTNPPLGHCLSTIDGTGIMMDLQKIFNDYTSPEQMIMCHHPWDTQLNEALNQSISLYTPKNRNYSKSMGLES